MKCVCHSHGAATLSFHLMPALYLISVLCQNSFTYEEVQEKTCPRSHKEFGMSNSWAQIYFLLFQNALRECEKNRLKSGRDGTELRMFPSNATSKVFGNTPWHLETSGQIKQWPASPPGLFVCGTKDVAQDEDTTFLRKIWIVAVYHSHNGLKRETRTFVGTPSRLTQGGKWNLGTHYPQEPCERKNTAMPWGRPALTTAFQTMLASNI